MPAADMHTPRRAVRTSTPRMVVRMVTTTIITTMAISTTSIAITTTITVTPMLMTTSKPPAKPRRGLSGASVARTTGGPDGMNAGQAAALYRLMTWLSPSFPVGAFSYSSGIEWAVEARDIHDASSLRDWLSSMLADGPGFCDGVFLAHAHRAAASRLIPLGQTDSQRVLASLEPIVVSTAKRALESSLEQLGSATFRADLASMRHETQYTRLFRS